MLIEGGRSTPTVRLPGVLLLVAGLVLGGLSGFLAARGGPRSVAVVKLPRHPPPPVAVNVMPPGAANADQQPEPLVALPEPAPGELGLLQVTIAPEDWETLARERDLVLQRGIHIQDEDSVVAAAVTLGSEHAIGTARLKGDLPDHFDTDQWSLRFQLKEPIRGMRYFSVEHPQTRGYVMEWLVMATARHEGVLAPRSDFVRVAINGVEKGVYYLEEHFSKELLESQRRREGPIVRFDESAMWATWLQHGSLRTGILTPDLQRTASLQDARIDAYSEGRLGRIDGLNAQLMRALQQTRDMQLLATADLKDQPLRHLATLRELQGRTVDELFSIERLGRWLAIYTVFRAWHGLAWHQLRFYHDPVLDRLEPIVFDTGANLLEHPGELALSSPEANWCRSSDAVMAATFAELGRMTEPGWLEGVLRDVGPQLLRDGAALSKAGIIPPGVDIRLLLSVVLPQQIASLREIVRPVAAAGFAATAIGHATARQDDRVVEVEAWAATEIPTQVTGFRQAGGPVIPAGEALQGFRTEPYPGAAVHKTADGGVLLPREGLHVLFKIPLDPHLTGLSEVQTIKHTIRNGVEPGPGKVLVDVSFRTLAESRDRVEALAVRRAPAADTGQLGRPSVPTLTEVLKQYPFLHYDFDSGHLCLDPGRHDLDGDLVLPEQLPVQLAAGTELRFPRGAVMLCAAVLAEGTREQPVRLLPRDPAQGWSGLQVLGGGGESRFRFVEVEHCTAVERGGWQSTGGVTCTGAPVVFEDCIFRSAHCEDSVNLINIRFRCERCTWAGGWHDLLDGDFVNGEVIDCHFADSGEDGIDISGSQVNVRGCTFEKIGDKAFSVGEASTLTATGCHVISASIGAASKDRSNATITDLTVDSVEHYALAAFIKKAEFGPARLTATGLHWTGEGKPPLLAQTGCVLTVDGVPVPTQDVDVAASYHQGILGKEK